MARWSKKGLHARKEDNPVAEAESGETRPQGIDGVSSRMNACAHCAAANSRTHKALHLAFTLLAVVALTAAGTLPRLAQAQDDKAEPALITIQVEGHNGTLPTLVSGTDFTLGQPVKADPCFMTDADGKQPLASLIEQKQAQGLKIVWHTEDGMEFDWLSTPVIKTITVTGTFVAADYQVAVSFNDGKTDDLSVSVPKGESFMQAYGSEPPAPSKEGWEFVRWVDASTNETFDFNSPVESSTSVYASSAFPTPRKSKPPTPPKASRRAFRAAATLGQLGA